MFKKKKRADAALIADIRSTAALLARAHSAAGECADPLLLESAVYRIKYLEARYAYLTRLAREKGVAARKFIPAHGGKKHD